MVILAAANYATTATGMAAVVPERMILTQTMKEAPLSLASVIPLEFNAASTTSDSSNKVQEKTAISGNEMIQRHMGTIGSVAFVVRRPG